MTSLTKRGHLYTLGRNLLVVLTASQVALVVMNLPANIWNVRNAGGSIPGLGRSPGKRHGNPLQYSCLENPMDSGSWSSTVHGVIQSRHDWSILGHMHILDWMLKWILMLNFKIFLQQIIYFICLHFILELWKSIWCFLFNILYSWFVFGLFCSLNVFSSFPLHSCTFFTYNSHYIFSLLCSRTSSHLSSHFFKIVTHN